MKVRVIKDMKGMPFTLGKDYEVFETEQISNKTVYKVYDDDNDRSYLEEGEVETIEQKPWYYNGELPPVGEVCSTIHSSKMDSDVKVLTHCFVNGKQATVVQEVNDEFSIRWVLSEVLCPLKSQEEIEKEKQVEELNEHLDNWFSNELYDDANEKTLSEYLYSLGYRKIK